MGADRFDSLLDALAQKLPLNADRATIIAALKAAAEALPKSQAKTRAKLGEAEAVKESTKKLRSRRDAAATETVKEDMAESVAAPADDVRKHTYTAEACEDVEACAARCSQLLKKACASATPVENAEEALDGFVAVMAALEEKPINVAMLDRCAKLVPLASTALGGAEPSQWRQFLGCVLTATVRAADEKAAAELEEVAARIGSLVALVASPLAARAALRMALVAAGPDVGSPVLGRLAPAVLPVLYAGFGVGGCFCGGERSRGELTALLYGLCFVGRCKASASEKLGVTREAVAEAGDVLRNALERHFDTAALLPEISRIAAGAPQKALSEAWHKRLRSLAAGDAAGKHDAPGLAALIREALEVLARQNAVSAIMLGRLAGSSGLVAAEEEAVDKQAAAARARGDVFFEDLAGLDVASAGVAGTEIEEAVSSLAMARLDGLEVLKNAPKDKEGKSKKSKVGKVKTSMGAVESDSDEEPVAAVDELVTSSPKRTRKKKKGPE